MKVEWSEFNVIVSNPFDSSFLIGGKGGRIYEYNLDNLTLINKYHTKYEYNIVIIKYNN